MSKMLRNCFLIATFLVQALHLNAQTVVFSDDFPGPIPGFPPPGYTVMSGSTDFTPGSSAGMQIGGSAGSLVFTNDQLAAWVSVATFPMGITNNGYTQGTAALSTYSTPFNPTLNMNTQLVQWNFNMQTGKLATGFTDGRDNAAVVLVCDNPDVRHAGNGYAVTYEPFVPGGLRLIRYSGGLMGAVINVVSSGPFPFLFSPTNYASFRVTYDPVTDDWELSARDDGPTSFSDPLTGTYTSFGTTTDATFTGTAMTHFGYYANYSVKYVAIGDADVLNAYFDSYSVRMICANISGDLTTCVGGYTTLSHPMTGGTWSSSTPAVGTVNAVGEVTGLSAGTTTIVYTSGTCSASEVVTVDPTVISPITGTATFCRGATSLFSSAPAGGFWYNLNGTLGSIDLSGLYTSTLAGNDTVIYEFFPGCSTRRTVHIDSSEAITGTATVCASGGTTTMANSISGGTWSSSATTTFTVNATTGVITGVNPGTATLAYTNPYGCTTNRIVTVYALPAAITGDFQICVGTTTTLNSGPAGGTWSHSSSGAGTVNATTGAVTGTATGTVIITYTGTTPAACFRTAIVTVDPAPAAITGTATMCANASSTLSHSVGLGTWASSNTTNATVNSSGNVTGVIVTGGTATITYTLPSGCIATREVTVMALPNTITGTQSVCVNGTTTLNTTTAGATWSSGNTAVGTVGASNGVVGGVTAGTVNITTTGPNGCFRSVTVTVNSIPGALTGTASVCVASNTVLSSTTSGGSWTTSNALIATVIGGTVTGISNGTATITYNSLGCITTRIVTVNALPSAFTGPSTVCVNATVTLGSSPVGTWVSSNTAVGTVGLNDGIVGGITSGTTNVTYTIATGCQRIRTMTVNALPAAIGGPTTLCPGSSATLTNAAAGTWLSGNTPVATIVSGSGVYTGVAAGTAGITFTQTSTGCTISTVVTISAAPPAILTAIGDTTMCPGDFVTLTVSASPGVTYEWYNGASLIVGATLPTYVASTAGSYHAEVHVAAGCSSSSTPMTVTIVPATATVTVTGSTSACAGSPAILNANTGPGLTYQWQLAGSPLSGATNSSLTAMTSGSYAVRVTNTTGCWALSPSISITVNPVPSNVVTASGPLAICAGSSVTLTAASGPGYTYQWYDASGAIAGATSVSFTATTADGYYVTVTNTDGCTATSGLSAITLNPTPDVSITPNSQTIFCAGGSVVLEAAAGFQYQWYVGGVAIPGATNALYAATTSGGYRVRVTNATTGCSDMTHADTNVLALAPATVIALTPARFCWGGSSLLSTSVSGVGTYLSYQWFFNGSPIPGGTNPTHNANAVGNYHCVVGVPGSCTYTTGVIAVSSIPLPSPSVAVTATSVYSGNYYVSYQWYKNLVPISGATAYATPITGNGNYKVAVTDTNGCQSVSATYVLTGWNGPTAVVDIAHPEIRIFPSPAKETVNIESSVTVRAIITSMDGKVLIDQADARIINLKGMADGIYIITLFNENGQLVKTEKLLKQQ